MGWVSKTIVNIDQALVMKKAKGIEVLVDPLAEWVGGTWVEVHEIGVDDTVRRVAEPVQVQAVVVLAGLRSLCGRVGQAFHLGDKKQKLKTEAVFRGTI